MKYEIQKVNLSYFKRKNDSGLLSFGNFLIDNGKDKDFDPFRTTLDKMATDVTDFADKILKAENQGRIEKETKEISREKLIATISEYAYYITGASIYTPILLTKSGFIASTSTGGHYNPNLNLAAPFALKVTFRSKSQDYKLSFDLEDANLVVKNALEYSEDNGETWKNGTYFSGKSYVLSNLPRRKELLVRVKSFGRFSRESDFSSSLPIFLV